MHKAILTILLAVVSSSAAAEWVKVGAEYKGATRYADPTTISRSGSKATMWDVMDYKTPTEGPRGEVVLSQMNQQEYDCKEEKIRALYFSVHSKNMGNGLVVFSKRETQEWSPIVPGKAGEAMWELACGKRAPVSSADPSIETISKCFFVYAAIYQVGRDYPHTELFQFGQVRVGWIGGYVQAIKSNTAAEQVFKTNLEANKQAGNQIKEVLESALNTGDQSRFSWAINQAISCDRSIGIKTGFLPHL
jgi:hypothetical protein